MIRLGLFVVAALAVVLGGRAEACTTLPSMFKPGSPEAIAEEHEQKTDLASNVAGEDLVFVGVLVADRPVNLEEILLGPRDPDDPDGSPSAHRFWFTSQAVLKGAVDQPRTNVFSGTHMVACWWGVFPEKGDRVVVHARRIGAYWYGAFQETDILPYLEPLLR